MLLFGRLSERIVCPVVNVAGALPLFAAVSVHVQKLPRVVAPPTLFDLVSVRSGAVTATESELVLLPSLLSMMLLFGSTLAVPPARGFASVPMALGVAVKVTSNDPPAPIVTGKPLAVQVRSFVVIEQLMFALLVMPVNVPAAGTP